MSHITQNSQVILHFALRLANGETIDSTFDSRPASLVMGDGNLPRGFEAHILGLEAGAKETFEVPPVDGFGQYNQNNVHRVERKHFAPDMELSEGLIFAFSDPAGGEMPGLVTDFDEDFVTIDFNHPLAGKNLLFEVEILSVEPPPTD